MDIGIKLRELRRLRGLTQGEAAERSGLGVKTISSFETGTRASSMKMNQLESLLASYDVTIEQFFGPQLEALLLESDTDSQTEELLREVRRLPKRTRKNLVPWIRAVVRGATGLESELEKEPGALRDAPIEQYAHVDRDWDLLVCPN